MKPEICLVVGARPNFVKAAPVLREMLARGRCQPVLIHTGQHYDRNLSELFFEDLALPAPDVHLHVGAGSHAQQTAQVMERIEPVLSERKPACLVVFGDVNSTIAASLTAAKLGIPIAHVESGLRSFDRAMPEEINRILTDNLSDLLFTTEPSGHHNLTQAGFDATKIYFVGNTMVDSLLHNLPRARQLQTELRRRLELGRGEYAVLTLHRPSNVDQTSSLRQILDAVEELAHELPILFPVHPRTRRLLEERHRPEARDPTNKGLRYVEPLGYLEFIALLDGARVVLTDSGGIQEETTVLGVPCLTLRDNTERPVTLTHGTNRLVRQETDAILEAARAVLATPPAQTTPEPPGLWDGQAAGRILDVLERTFCAP